MKRILSLILAIFLLTGLFSGCARKSAPFPTEATEITAVTETTNPTTEPAETAPADPSKVTAAPTNPIVATVAPTEATNAPTEAVPVPTEPSLSVSPGFDSIEQEAVVKTALAFLDRGKYIQYDDSQLNNSTNPVVYRWEYGLKAPEDYTSQSIGYSNCAAFAHDVYWAALDYEVGAHSTRNFASLSTRVRRYTYYPTGQETSTEQAAVESAFRANLQVGDIIVVRYAGEREGNGHAMLYVGPDVLESGHDIIHSTGSTYSYKEFNEKEERNGTVQTMSTKSLFTRGSSLYTFSQLQTLCLIRPLEAFNGSIPENTCNRIRNMQGVVAEKLSSHTKGMTVNPGEEMTFTFRITNKNDTPVTLEVRDSVPSNTAYVSGADQVDGNALSWQVTVPANNTISISYTVQVNADAAYGDTVFGEDGTVGGVKTPCPKVYIQKTLTQEEQEKILIATEEITGKTGMLLADAIYQQATGKKTGLPTDFDTLDSSFFEVFFKGHRLRGEGGALDLIPTGMFGGRKAYHRTIASDYMRLEYCRTRKVQAEHLVVGDIILAVGGPNTPGNPTEGLYLFTGERLLNLNTGKTQPAQPLLNMLLGYDRFVVIRPSIGM